MFRCFRPRLNEPPAGNVAHAPPGDTEHLDANVALRPIPSEIDRSHAAAARRSMTSYDQSRQGPRFPPAPNASGLTEWIRPRTRGPERRLIIADFPDWLLLLAAFTDPNRQVSGVLVACVS